MSNIAVIDLGTNTAHILIGRKQDSSLDILIKKRQYTFLAEDGIDQISDAAVSRLFNALNEFKSMCKSYDAQIVQITGTEAFRKANNGAQIISKIQSGYNWAVDIISGDREADLIFKGVKSAVDITDGNYIVMDIGGGSVEFIISENGQLTWKESFPIGIANIFNSEYMNDELSTDDIDALKNYIKSSLSTLQKVLKKHSDITLIGAAGSFEILTKNVNKKDDLIYTEIDRSAFTHIMDEVIHLAPKDRAKLAWIPAERVQYVTAAIILIQVAVELTQTDKILISPYALKEGLASETLGI